MHTGEERTMILGRAFMRNPDRKGAVKSPLFNWQLLPSR